MGRYAGTGLGASGIQVTVQQPPSARRNLRTTLAAAESGSSKVAGEAAEAFILEKRLGERIKALRLKKSMGLREQVLKHCRSTWVRSAAQRNDHGGDTAALVPTNRLKLMKPSSPHRQRGLGFSYSTDNISFFPRLHGIRDFVGLCAVV